MLICPKCSKQAERGKLCRACGASWTMFPARNRPAIGPPPPAPAAAKRHSPLGLPSGSIRALLTFLIVAVVIAQIVRGQQVELLWTETLMIALAITSLRGG